MTSKHEWMAELQPGQSREIVDNSANRMAVSYWKRRAGINLRTRTINGGHMVVEHIDEPQTITIPLDSLTPYSCMVLYDEMLHQERDDLAQLFADIYADLTGDSSKLTGSRALASLAACRR